MFEYLFGLLTRASKWAEAVLLFLSILWFLALVALLCIVWAQLIFGL